MVVDGRPILAFCSNDYLGLANHPDVVAALQKAAERYGVGSGAAHLVNGHSREHLALEEELAAFTGRQRALLFSTGYMANLGVIAGLLSDGDDCFQDRLNHASLLDGALQSGARLHRYLHGDVDSLQKKLSKRSRESTALVATDGVFSMDGDLAPLSQLSVLCSQHQAWFMVDDAHGFGMLAENGAGSVVACGLDSRQVPIYMATLGKALGTFGAFVAGDEELIELLIQQARSYIYTTALPPALAAATRASLRLVQQESWRRDKLQSLVTRFRQGAAQLGMKLMSSKTAIQPIIVGESEQALAMSEALFAKGILVTAIRPPTVPKGGARLRITLSAAHSEQQVDRLLSALEQVA